MWYLIALSGSSVSEGVTYAQLLLEVLLSLLGNQLPSLRSAGASNRGATTHHVAAAVLPVCDRSIFDVGRLIC